MILRVSLGEPFFWGDGRRVAEQLPNTDWSMLGHISGGSDGRDRALEQLVRRYWPAIYAYVRRTGRDVHESSDLTQGFITTVILQRKLPEKAERERGRFRSLLLTSLRNYLHERHRYEARRKPARDIAGGSVFSGFDIDAAEGRAYESPEAAFNYHWSATMVRSVLERVRQACLRDDLAVHWLVFEARVAKPLLFGDEPVDMSKLAERAELEGPGQASNMIVTVKRRFVKALREEIRETIAGDDSVDEELATLLRDLERER